MNTEQAEVIIIDFGSQYTQLIARRIRELRVYCIVVPCNKVKVDDLKDNKIKAIILSGGPMSVYDKHQPYFDQEILSMGLPVLAICYGQQLLAKFFGANITQNNKSEYGASELEVLNSCKLFNVDYTKKKHHSVWMSHADSISTLPKGFVVNAKSSTVDFAVISNENKKLYGIQFHPEVTHTDYGVMYLKNFLFSIVKIKSNWSMEDFLSMSVENIKQQVGDKKVICGLSGGVDSSVSALLLEKAIGKQLHCVYVDTGMMRQGETEEVEILFKKNYNLNLHIVDASDLFLKRLRNVTDPEKKRKIIGKTFIDVFEKKAGEIKDIDFLAQGTLYPDVIESVSFIGGPSVTIKSHHNVGGLPKRMRMKLIEPLRNLFKDEVRDLGRQLNMPNSFIDRHPFPGPGLAIRIIGAVTKENLDILRQVDKIYIDCLKDNNLYNDIWQAFCVLLPVKSVGVMGDNRTYEQVIAIRAVTSVDGMTAKIFHFDLAFLEKLSAQIVNDVQGINRVVYDITSKPPSTIEWE